MSMVLRGSLMEISAKVSEAVVHQRLFAAMCYRNPLVLYFSPKIPPSPPPSPNGLKAFTFQLDASFMYKSIWTQYNLLSFWKLCPIPHFGVFTPKLQLPPLGDFWLNRPSCGLQPPNLNCWRQDCVYWVFECHECLTLVWCCQQGYRKHSLLREILPTIGADLRLQRLFSEYQQQLTSLTDVISWWLKAVTSRHVRLQRCDLTDSSSTNAGYRGWYFYIPIPPNLRA